MGRIMLIFKALEIAGILATDLPAALADGKITVDEMTAMMGKMLAVFDVPMEIRVPEAAIGAQVLTVKEV